MAFLDYMEWKTLRVEMNEQGVATVTLCRPKEMNALSTTVFEELNVLLPQLDEAQEVRAVSQRMI